MLNDILDLVFDVILLMSWIYYDMCGVERNTSRGILCFKRITGWRVKSVPWCRYSKT